MFPPVGGGLIEFHQSAVGRSPINSGRAAEASLPSPSADALMRTCSLLIWRLFPSCVTPAVTWATC